MFCVSESNSYIVTDFSTNGTFLNNERIPKRKPTQLFDGSVLTGMKKSFRLVLSYLDQSDSPKKSDKDGERYCWGG